MKKIICLLLMLVLCLGCFAACKDDGNTDDGSNNGGDTGDTGATKTTAEEAKELLFAMYKDESSTTQADYEVVGVIKVGDKTCNIVWTVDVTTGVTVGAITDKKMVPIDVDEEAGADIAYKLTATITDPEGNTATVVLDRTVPKFQVNTLEEYLAAKEGDALVVEGIISAMNSKSVGNKRNHLFLVDASGKGGYYIYQMDQDPIADLNLKVGMTVRVAGPAAPYSGMMEIKGGAVTKVIDTTEKTVEAVDISEEFLKEAPNFAPYVGMLVTVKGVTIAGQELGGSSDYLFFTKGAIKSYVRSYLTDLPTSVKEADKATIEAFHASKNGYVADVTGVVVLYNGAPYLMPVSAEPFTNVTLPERTDAEKVAFELGNVNVVASVTKDTVVTLPIASVTYPDTVTYAWTIDNDKFTIGEDGTLSIKLGNNAVKLTLTLTVTCGEATDSKNFVINVPANMVMSTTKPYYGYVNQLKAQKEIWLDGGVDGRYLTTTEDPSKAVAIYAEKATDGYKFYIVVDDAKLYITLYKNEENNDSLKYDAEGTTTFSYDPTVNAWMINGSTYYIGTYNKFTTISASGASYLTPENSGVENFPVNFDFARPGDSFNMSVAQNNADVNKVVYVTGADDGRYLVTTENVADAAAVYAEKVAGGFKFYIVVEEAKLYLTVYKNDADKDAVKFAADGNSVFNYDGATNALVTDFNGTKYYIGTYSTYTTLSASKFSYINAENTGVSQFPAELVAIGTTEDPENPDPENPNPENPGDTPTIPVEPPVEGEDVITTYVSNDELLTIAVNETKGTVTFTFAPPTGNSVEATYDYTVGDDGVVLTKDGEAVNPLAAALTMEEGVVVSATWNGYEYSFVAEETTEEEVEVYNGVFNGVDMVVTINYTNGTVTFSYVHPRNNMEVNEEYTFVADGNNLKLSFAGTEVPVEDYAIVLEDGNVVAAVYTAVTFELTAEGAETPEEPEEPVEPEEPEENEFEITIEEAIAIGGEKAHDTYTTDKYWVTGTIKSVYQTQYGNMYIVDENGNELCIYGTYSEDGSIRYDALAYKPVKGDVVTVYGVLGKYNSTIQMKSGWIVECDAHEHNYTSVVTNPTCLLGGYTTHTCSVCNGSYVDTEVEKLGHTTENGTCERCGTVVGEGANTDPVTVSKTVADLIKEYGWTDATTKQSFNLDNIVSVKIDGGSNTGKAYNGDHIRVYATDTPAGTLTISVPEGYELVSVKVSAQTGTYAFLYVEGTTTDICNQTVEVSGNSVLLQSVKNGSNGKQVRITAIEVTYKPVG